MFDFLSKVRYYLWASYRRRLLDSLQEKYRKLYRGVVFDIGGRDRGKFEKPKTEVDKWVFVDIVKDHKPDLLLDVSNMEGVKSETVDVVNAIELFEHVYDIELGLKEVFRVLKGGGHAILSAPFIHPIHADPDDFQRWTEYKWGAELKKVGFDSIEIIKMGGYFAVLADMLKTGLKNFPKPINYFFYIFYPGLEILFRLDRVSKFLDSYTTGYFIVVKKS